MVSGSNTDGDFTAQLERKVRVVNKAIERILSQPGLIGRELEEPIRYALEGGGKRVRSAIVLWCCELMAGAVNHNAEIAAAAIEMVHTYSLIHDDLPVMDDDDYRRGRLACHKKFDEATAILVGDGLLTLAFEVLAKQIEGPETAVQLICELAEAAGPAGMVAGQMADLQATGSSAFSVQRTGNRNKLRAEHCPLSAGAVSDEALRYIHTNKTAKMFRCAAVMGGICGSTALTTGGVAGREGLLALREYGLKIGLGFQVADDILDVCAGSEQLGKTSGKDARQGKVTYPAVAGLEESRRLAERVAGEAVAALKPFGAQAEGLRWLATMLLNRTK